MKTIKITAGSVTGEAVLANTACAQAIWDILPYSTRAQTWGDEVYFSVPVRTGLDASAREVVEIGDLGYWPEGPAFCIFFGPTPISKGNEIRPASAVNVVGKLSSSPVSFRAVTSGSAVTLARLREDA
jgi:uncharacterized protein